MKAIRIARTVIFLTMVFTSPKLLAQALCSDGEEPYAISYYSIVTGNGNNTFTFNYPQFDPSVGTLGQVRLDAYVTMKFACQLENRDASTINYRVRVERMDDITSASLTVPLSNTLQRTYGQFPLQPWDGIAGNGGDFISLNPTVLNSQHIPYSINNTAPFMGHGTVNFNYETTTFSTVIGSVNHTINSSAIDTLHFRLTYYYCPTWFLPAEITNFTANRKTDNNVQLKWLSPNDVAGTKYIIEKSADGRNFTEVKTVESKGTERGDFQYLYNTTGADKKFIFFRIKQIEKAAVPKYSVTRKVTLEEQPDAGMKVYPTVVTNNQVNVFFPGNSKEDWQVNVISMSGQTLESKRFNNTNLIRMPFTNRLSNGVYVVEAINLKTQVRHNSKIVVQ